MIDLKRKALEFKERKEIAQRFKFTSKFVARYLKEKKDPFSTMSSSVPDVETAGGSVLSRLWNSNICSKVVGKRS